MPTSKSRAHEPSVSKDAAASPATESAEPAKQPSRQERAAACGEAIKAALAKYRCRIVPYLLDPEPVGQDGSRIMLTATYGLVADQSE